MPGSEDRFLGALAVREQLCTEEQIQECFRVQANCREAVPLGHLLVYKGYLTEFQKKDLLLRHAKRIQACPLCGHLLTGILPSEPGSARCPKCRGVLGPAPADAPSRTGREDAPRRAPEPSPRREPASDLRCIICDHAFGASADAAGRVRCPSCRSTFRPERAP